MKQIKIDEALVEKHFDSMADVYDRLKKEKNWYYYQSLIQWVSSVVPPEKRILDIGTGTGEILNALCPSEDIGIDLSGGMIKKAKEKFPGLHFLQGSYENFHPEKPFDFILLVDVIEHLQSPENLFLVIKRFCHTNTEIILTMANPTWEPLLYVLEKLKLKMDEGPHFRISEKKLLNYALNEGFFVKSSDTLILLPIYVPLISSLFNKYAVKLPLVKQLALVKCYILKALV